LSALLAEINGTETMYLQAATEAADFIRNHLYTKQNIVLDQIYGAETDNCTGKLTLIEPYNTGLVIESLSILASITGDASTQQM
ncbi:hypothetical protein B0H13DRAFT_1644326, partial [Mycena leptocephala]